MEVETGKILVVTGTSKEEVQNQYHSYLEQANNNREGKQYRAKDASISVYTENEEDHYTLGFMLEETPEAEQEIATMELETEGINDVVDSLLSAFTYTGGTEE